MGYDLHITRKGDWPNKGDEISLEEWLAVVAADPEMRLDGYAEAPLPDGKVLRVESPSLAVWTAWSHNGKDGNMAWIDWSRGNIDAKNPDRAMRRKMWRLAQVLNARVQGDDGEFYDDWGDGAYEPLPPPDTEPDIEYEFPRKNARGWLQRILSRFSRTR